MGFEAELRTFLEGLIDGRLDRAPVKRRQIDDEHLRRHLLRRLGESDDEDWVRESHEQWSRYIPSFARFLEALPQDAGLIADCDAQVLACHALDRALGQSLRGLPLVQRLELSRVVSEFLGSGHRELGAFDIPGYVLAAKLVRDAESSVALTSLGRGFLRLRGKDAIRWLLIIETTQSTGRWDRFCASRALFHEALSRPLETWFVHGRRCYPYDAATLRRLESLGVLYGLSVDGEDQLELRIADELRDVVETVLIAGPWHRAITAALEDETALAVPGLGMTATEAAIEQTKLMAHEARNALIPARIQLEALRGAVPQAQLHRLDAARRGISRVLTFVDEMLATSELVADTVTSFELAAVVREALGWLEDAERVGVVTLSSVTVRGPRAPFARAVSNVVRNALQATGSGQRVEVRIEAVGEVARVIVDDAGPGVPEDKREQVFQEGFTTRSDGRGYGLAYVRRVVADALRGRVWCEDSDLGGARFVIELPGTAVIP